MSDLNVPKLESQKNITFIKTGLTNVRNDKIL